MVFSSLYVIICSLSSLKALFIHKKWFNILIQNYNIYINILNKKLFFEKFIKINFQKLPKEFYPQEFDVIYLF